MLTVDLRPSSCNLQLGAWNLRLGTKNVARLRSWATPVLECSESEAVVILNFAPLCTGDTMPCHAIAGIDGDADVDHDGDADIDGDIDNDDTGVCFKLVFVFMNLQLPTPSDGSDGVRI